MPVTRLNTYTLNTDAGNNRIAAWGKEQLPQLRAAAAAMGVKHRTKTASVPSMSVKKMKASFKRGRTGFINNIGIGIERHLVYVNKGVGRDTPIEKAGTTNRKPKPFFNQVIDRNIEGLADIVAEEYGSAIINNLLIK